MREIVNKLDVDKNSKASVFTKDFNIRSLQNSSWLDFKDIDNTYVYTEEELRKFDRTTVIGAFDLSKTNDMTAFNTLLRDRDNNRLICITMYWVTANFYNTQISQKTNVIPWASWLERGLVKISGTNAIDYKDIINYVLFTFKERGYNYYHINYDPWSATYLIKEFENLGYVVDKNLIPIRQGAKTLSIPMQLLETHLKNKILCFQNNPITKWCLSNIQLVQDTNGNYSPKKVNDDPNMKIDGAAVILNCYVSVANDLNYFIDLEKQK
jgi:phage terminase large subunit-like protein